MTTQPQPDKAMIPEPEIPRERIEEAILQTFPDGDRIYLDEVERLFKLNPEHYPTVQFNLNALTHQAMKQVKSLEPNNPDVGAFSEWLAGRKAELVFEINSGVDPDEAYGFAIARAYTAGAAQRDTKHSAELATARLEGERVGVTDGMVDRFLTWVVPDEVVSDRCMTLPYVGRRYGTNIMDAQQAKAMLEYVLLPPTPTVNGDKL